MMNKRQVDYAILTYFSMLAFFISIIIIGFAGIMLVSYGFVMDSGWDIVSGIFLLMFLSIMMYECNYDYKKDVRITMPIEGIK